MKHYNPSLSQELIRQTNSKGENIPPDVQEFIQPVISVDNVPIEIVRAQDLNSTGSATLFTTPTDKDFYIRSATLSAGWNASNDGTNAVLTMTIQGTNKNFLAVSHATLVAGSGEVGIFFGEKGIKVDRNTNITMTQTFTLGAGQANSCIYGYLQEVRKGGQ